MAGKKTGKPLGRPTKLTEETRHKIEEAAALDAPVSEICYYADISRDCYYRWLKENPDLNDRITKLRERPILAARQTVVKEATKSYGNAIDYLSRKRKDEFSTRSEVTGKDGNSLFNEEQKQKADESIREFIDGHAK